MRSYLITDPRYYGTSTHFFRQSLNRSLIKYNPDFVCFRDKTEGDKNLLLEIFSEISKTSKAVFLLNGSIEGAKKYGLGGVHLRGEQQSLIKEAKSSSLLTVVSCHTVHDVSHSIELGADYVTLSPLFASPEKGEPIGIEAFETMISNIDRQKVFALGGIDNESRVRQVLETGVFGFASIRYFVR